MDSVSDIILDKDNLGQFLAYAAAMINKGIMPKTHQLSDITTMQVDFGLKFSATIGVIERAQINKAGGYLTISQKNYNPINFTVGSLETYENAFRKFEREVAKWVLKNT